ncbi:hypothetical protein PIROE2DRAFT_17176, partial [Piromyces sp. E2]
SENRSNSYSSTHLSTLKVNLIHPIFNPYTRAKPTILRNTLYYQYLPPPSTNPTQTPKSKITSKLNQPFDNTSSSSTSNSIHDSYIPLIPSVNSSTTQIKKELHPTVSLPNLNTSSSSILTAFSSTTAKAKKDEDLPEKVVEENDILLYPITQGIEEDQQTLKKLQKKVNLLRKENQDLLNTILTKRMSKERHGMENASSLSLHQIKIIL